MEESNYNWPSNSNSNSSAIHEEENNIGCSLSMVPQIGLSLELGRGGSDHQCEYSYENINKVGIIGNNNNKLARPYIGGFTILQLEELQLQALIYKYISAGIPVPNHLLYPICQSFSTSFSAFPTSLGIGQMCLESTRKGIDQEPWRCRRTDGKKWRCGKEAIPHHKYCERHIHRGRQRSRKLVDSSSKSTTTTQFGSNMTHLSISLPQNGSSNSTINHFP